MNDYSQQWFKAFMETIPVEWTRAEIAGVTRRLPLPGFRRVLDVCCGPARHAGPLLELGYNVTGIDRDEHAVATARERAPGGQFLVLDQRSLSSLGGTYDAAMILWQSFGYFDADTNDNVLTDLAGLLRPGGRVLLDVFHPRYFRAHEGRLSETRSPECVAIMNTMRGDRLNSTIEYADGTVEVMDFELFEPEALATRGRSCGLEPLEACTWWDQARPPDPTEARYQLVLERR